MVVIILLIPVSCFLFPVSCFLFEFEFLTYLDFVFRLEAVELAQGRSRHAVGFGN